MQAVPLGTKFIRGWDFAATEGAGDYTAGVKIGRTKEGRFIIVHAVRDRLSPAGVDRLLKATVSQDGYQCAQSLPQDPGAAGKSQSTYQVGQLAGYIVASSTESGAKYTRALPLAAQAEAGNVDVLVGDWNGEYLDELCVFPAGAYDDQVDASSRAFNELVNNNSLGVWARLGK